MRLSVPWLVHLRHAGMFSKYYRVIQKILAKASSSISRNISSRIYQLYSEDSSRRSSKEFFQNSRKKYYKKSSMIHLEPDVLPRNYIGIPSEEEKPF